LKEALFYYYEASDKRDLVFNPRTSFLFLLKWYSHRGLRIEPQISRLFCVGI